MLNPNNKKEQQPMVMASDAVLNLKLKVVDVNLVLEALLNMPMGRVQELVGNIHGQIEEQHQMMNQQAQGKKEDSSVN